MRFGGFQPFSLSDFPGCVAAIAFAQGCNFRCPFCHNGSLLPKNPPQRALFTDADILGFLKQRKRFLDGVVITGGEPTIHDDLETFLGHVRTLGLKIKLDTNGSRPEQLSRLIRYRFVDYVAMDVKAPLHKYSHLSGVPVDAQAIRESIGIISNSGIPHHFRTTAVNHLLNEHDLQSIREGLPSHSLHVVQPFKPDNALDRMVHHTHPIQ